MYVPASKSFMEKSPRIHFNPVQDSNTSYKGVFDDVLEDDNISYDLAQEIAEQKKQLNLSKNINLSTSHINHNVVANTSTHNVSDTTRQQINHSQLLEERLERIEKSIESIQRVHKEDMNEMKTNLQQEIEAVKSFTTTLIDTSLKNYHRNFEAILNSFGSRSVSPNLSDRSDKPSSIVPLTREPTAYVEQLKAEMEIKVESIIRDVEERVMGRVTDVDYRFNQGIAALHKSVDDKLERQQKVIGRMTEEQRWIEEEGIKLRVEHEAKVESMIRSSKSDLEEMVEEAKRNLALNSEFVSKLQGVESSIETLKEQIVLDQEKLKHLAKKVSGNSGRKEQREITSNVVPSVTTSRATSSRTSPSKSSSSPKHSENSQYNLIQALLSKSREVMERNQSLVSYDGSNYSGSQYRSASPAEREY